MKTRLIAVLVVVAGLVAACSSGEGTGGQLDGTEWILRVIPGRLDPHARPRDRVRGRPVRHQPGRRLRRLQPLRRAVPRRRTDAVHHRPGQHADGLRRTVDGLRDRVPGAARPESLLHRPRQHADDLRPGPRDPPRVRRRARNPLLGRWVVDSYSNAPGSVVAVLPAPSWTSCSGSATSPASPAATSSAAPTAPTATSSGSAARHHAPRVRGRRHGPGDRLPRSA